MATITAPEEEVALILGELHADACLCHKLGEILVVKGNEVAVSSETGVNCFALASVMAGLAVRLESTGKKMSTWQDR